MMTVQKKYMKITYQSKHVSTKFQLINIIRIMLFAGVGLWLFGGIGHTIDLFQYYGAENWPKSKVKIIESRISQSGYGTKICNTPNIKYIYNFKEKQITSNKWGFSFFNCSSANFANDVTSRYRVGTEVDAYVNPDSGRAVLEIDLSPLWLVTFIGISCCIIIWIIRPKPIPK